MQLPKVKMADGTICQSYVAQVTKTHSGASAPERFVVRVVMNQVCSKAKLVSSGFFGGGGKKEVPEILKSMNIVTVAGLSHQVPYLHRAINQI